MRKEKFLILFLAIFILGDITYSFLEYYYTPIDGDLSSGIAPNSHIQKIFDDPLGFKLLSSGERHINPNRYFSHLVQKEYMLKMPIWLQNFVDPITSVYLACALLKTFVHLLFLSILSFLIAGTPNIAKRSFLTATSLLVPFIQVNGYWGHMGINDRATTYVFFFALPLVLLMAFFVPAYQIVYQEKAMKFNFLSLLFLLAPAIMLPLSGPLIPGVVLIICFLVGVCYFLRNSSSAIVLKIPGQLYLILVPIALASFYSLILGQFDSNYEGHKIPIFERYLKLPLGIYYQITQSLGVPLILLTIGINYFLIKKYFNTEEGKRIVRSLKWIGLFALIYLLLLPCGGYRPYRPNILRYDTFIPITIALIYFYGKSTFFLVNNFKNKALTYYGIFLLALFAIFMNSDRIETERYHFERACLETLAKSPDDITKLPATFNVMSWEPLSTPEQSECNATMLKYWNITKEKKLYYQTDK